MHIRVLQWIFIFMDTQYPPILMAKCMGNGYGLGCMGDYKERVGIEYPLHDFDVHL